MIHIVYPIPFDAWSTFEPFVDRFTRTFKEFPPDRDYVLHAMAIYGMPTDHVQEMFYGIKTRYHFYTEDGCDIGSAQSIADDLPPEDWMLMMTSRCYFHRRSWLAPYVRATDKFGNGLYGASVSNEGGKLHVCTRAYMMTAQAFVAYPELIDTRAKGQLFEVGEWCLTDWFKKRRLPRVQVTWDGERKIDQARCAEETAIYRRGEQQAMVVWDKHTDAYRDANPEEKERLAKLADGV